MIQLWWETLFHMSGFPYNTSDYRQWAKILSINCTESTTKNIHWQFEFGKLHFSPTFILFIFMATHRTSPSIHIRLYTLRIYMAKHFSLHQMKKKCLHWVFACWCKDKFPHVLVVNLVGHKQDFCSTSKISRRLWFHNTVLAVSVPL